MTIKQQKIQTIIKTFSDEMYIIENKTPDEVRDAIDRGGDMVRMPNGAHVHRKSISSLQSFEDYNFQAEQKAFHKKGNYIKRNEWIEYTGIPLGIDAHLERITGDLKNPLLGTNQKQLN